MSENIYVFMLLYLVYQLIFYGLLQVAICISVVLL